MKRIILFLILTISVFAMTSCGDSEEQKQRNEQCIKTAKTNAIKYIEDKYGFTPTIINAVLERTHGVFNSNPLTTVYVRMQYNDRNFGVYIDGLTENTDGKDNYQTSDIIEYFNSIIAQKLPEPEKTSLDGGTVHVHYSSIRDECINLYSNYFDVSEPMNFLENSNCLVCAEYVNTDISSITKSDFPQYLFEGENSRNEITIISYRKNKYIGENQIEKMYPLYMNERIVINKEGTKRDTYSLGKVGDISYYIEGENSDTITVKEVKPDNASNWCDDDDFIYKIASKAYSFHSDHDCKVKFYFPCSAFTEPGDEVEYYGICRGSGDNKKYELRSKRRSISGYDLGTIVLNANEDVYVVFLEKKERNLLNILF